MIVMPAIDIRAGRVVRLKQGDFGQMRQFERTPVELAQTYRTAGASWLHAVDLDGARAGRPVAAEVLVELVGSGLPVQWGGGVRSTADVEAVLAAGASRVVVGSVAVDAPARFSQWLAAFGGDRLCLALDLRRDAAGRWLPAVSAWQEQRDVDIVELLDMFAGQGLQHVLCTDIDCDGMAAGPNLELYGWLARQWPALQWIASGGVRDARDVAALADSGVAACVAGTALLEGTLPLTALAGRAG